MDEVKNELRSSDELKLLQAQLARDAAWQFWRFFLLVLFSIVICSILQSIFKGGPLNSEFYIWLIFSVCLALLILFVVRHYLIGRHQRISTTGVVCTHCSKSNYERFWNLWLTGKCYFCKQQMFDLSTKEVEVNGSDFNYNYADFKAMSAKYQKRANKLFLPWFLIICIALMILFILYKSVNDNAFNVALVIGLLVLLGSIVKIYLSGLRLMKEYPAIRCPCCYEPIRDSKVVEESGCCDECGRKIFRDEPKNDS